MKIVQIQVVTQPGGPDWNAFQEMYALCDDGTVLLLPYPATKDRSRLKPEDRCWQVVTSGGLSDCLSNPTDHQAPASGALVHPVVGQPGDKP